MRKIEKVIFKEGVPTGEGSSEILYLYINIGTEEDKTYMISSLEELGYHMASGNILSSVISEMTTPIHIAIDSVNKDVYKGCGFVSERDSSGKIFGDVQGTRYVRAKNIVFDGDIWAEDIPSFEELLC